MQGAFNNPELEELEHLAGVDIIVDGDDLPNENDVVLDGAGWGTRRKVDTLRRLVSRKATPGNKRIVFRFLSSPIELTGSNKVEQVLVIRNHLERDEQGNLQARPTEEETILDAGLVLRAIGYRGTPYPGLPFDERRGVIRNRQGRVASDDDVLPGVYVTGWIKRGCRGIIGSNKKCARETVDCLLEDREAGRLSKALSPTGLDRDAVMAIVSKRKPDLVLINEWLRIDHAERDAGRPHHRPRVKITDRQNMLACAHDEN